jgi:hypothetical protein
MLGNEASMLDFRNSKRSSNKRAVSTGSKGINRRGIGEGKRSLSGIRKSGDGVGSNSALYHVCFSELYSVINFTDSLVF